MKITLSCIKADIGSIGGHAKPSQKIIDAVTRFIGDSGKVIDFRVFHTGDDIAILMTHANGKDDKEIHQLAWDAFVAGTQVAKSQGLYGAGQDLLKDSFSGNVKGMGPAVAELEFEERPNEPFVWFAADKTEPGAYNLPLYLTFTDPFHNGGLMLSPRMHKGFKFVIMDVSFTKADRIIELDAPEELYDIAALLRDTETYIVEGVYSRTTGEQCAAASTTRLHNIAGHYTGKDDPVMLVRVQGDFPAAGEVLSPYATAAYVAGDCRGSHHIPLMPMPINSATSFFDGPAIVSCLGFCVKDGRLTEHVDNFVHPFWDFIRDKASQKTLYMREQGFFNPAMLGMGELEYTGIMEKLEKLEKRFKVRKKD